MILLKWEIFLMLQLWLNVNLSLWLQNTQNQPIPIYKNVWSPKSKQLLPSPNSENLLDDLNSSITFLLFLKPFQVYLFVKNSRLKWNSALSWILISPTPGPHVKEMKDAAMFYTNRVLKDYKGKFVNVESRPDDCVFQIQVNKMINNTFK